MGPRLLHALLHRAAAPPESDADLLARFVASRDEPAFAELVRRYAGLVWGQCRNLLPNEADAEDAFQATFLALARRPDAVRAAVGPYLHGVAYRVCLNARRLAGRRKKREVASATSEAERPVADSAWDTALAAVHTELHRLPESQRVAFVLCVLEGRGLTDAAAHLGVKLGTLSARLSRAKQAVMDRLAAKGVVAGLAAVAALAPAGATAALAEKAVQSAVGVASDAVLSLTHGVTKMVAFKAKVLAAAVLLATGLGLGVGSGWVATAQYVPPGFPPRPKQPSTKLDAELAVKPVLGESEFRYIPLPDDGVTAAAFEKLVKGGETDGYTFAGCVPMIGRKGDKDGAVIQALVFRKKPAEKAVPPAPSAAGAKPEKLYAVSFDAVPWADVFHWLAEELKLTITDLGKDTPRGTCTLKLDRKVAIGELMDLLNEILAQQKMTLIRGQQVLRFWPADKTLPQIYVSPVEDLSKYGKSEIVKVVLPLKGVTAEDAEKAAKKLLSPFGMVVGVGNQLVVIDRAGEVRAIRAIIEK